MRKEQTHCYKLRYTLIAIYKELKSYRLISTEIADRIAEFGTRMNPLQNLQIFHILVDIDEKKE